MQYVYKVDEDQETLCICSSLEKAIVMTKDFIKSLEQDVTGELANELPEDTRGLMHTIESDENTFDIYRIGLDDTCR